MKKGKLIVFEGLDGSGKSTQAARVAEYLNGPAQKLVFGYKGVHLTKEPTTNLIGGLIRSRLNGDWQSSSECLQLLFAADRAYHLEKEVLPLLEKGVMVISDRYFFSSIAYGGLDLDSEWLASVNKNFFPPDFTFFIDVSAKTGMERISGERYELTLFEKEKELAKVRTNFHKTLKQFKNVFMINGEQSPDEVTRNILKVLDSKLSL